MTLIAYLSAVLLQDETAATNTAPILIALRESITARLAVMAAAQIHMELLDIATRAAAASTGLVPAVDCCSWSPPAMVTEDAGSLTFSGVAVPASSPAAVADAAVVERASSLQATGGAVSAMSQTNAAAGPKQVCVAEVSIQLPHRNFENFTCHAMH